MSFEVYKSMGGTLPDPPGIYAPGDGNHAPMTQAEQDAAALASLNATAEEAVRSIGREIGDTKTMRDQIHELESITWVFKCAAEYALDVDGFQMAPDAKRGIEEALLRAEQYTIKYYESHT